MFECDIVFDDDFIRENLSFLLDDESIGTNKRHLSHENESSIYKTVTAELECSVNMSWSSSSSGSICSVKEETTKYVNVFLSCDKSKPKPSLSLENRFSFDFDISENGTQGDNSFTIMDFPPYLTSTPVKHEYDAVHNEKQPTSSCGICRDTSILAEPLDNSDITLEPEHFCNFCRKNGEPQNVYSSHVTKLSDGTVKCPILMKYVCELCGATGRNAHTRKYCPLYKRKFQPKTTSRRLSNGVMVTCFNHK